MDLTGEFIQDIILNITPLLITFHNLILLDEIHYSPMIRPITVWFWRVLLEWHFTTQCLVLGNVFLYFDLGIVGLSQLRFESRWNELLEMIDLIFGVILECYISEEGFEVILGIVLEVLFIKVDTWYYTLEFKLVSFWLVPLHLGVTWSVILDQIFVLG